MVLTVNFKGDRLIPNKGVIFDGLIIGVSALVVLFIFQNFGFASAVNALPEGYKILIAATLGVYIKHLFSIRIGNSTVL